MKASNIIIAAVLVFGLVSSAMAYSSISAYFDGNVSHNRASDPIEHGTIYIDITVPSSGNYAITMDGNVVEYFQTAISGTYIAQIWSTSYNVSGSHEYCSFNTVSPGNKQCQTVEVN